MSSYLSQQVQRIAEKKDYVILSGDALVGQAAKVMRDKDISSVLVASDNNNNSNEPVGIVTEKDIVYHVLAECNTVYC